MNIDTLCTYLKESGLIVAAESIETNRGGRHAIRVWSDAEAKALDTVQHCTHAFIALRERGDQRSDAVGPDHLGRRLIDLSTLVVLFPSGVRIRYTDSTAKSQEDRNCDFVDHCLAVAQAASAGLS